MLARGCSLLFTHERSTFEALLTYIANNTCYLELDPHKAALPQYTLTTEDDPEATLLGDVNGDGIVNVTDVIAATNMTIGITPSVFIFENADVNKDNESRCSAR